MTGMRWSAFSVSHASVALGCLHTVVHAESNEPAPCMCASTSGATPRRATVDEMSSNAGKAKVVASMRSSHDERLARPMKSCSGVRAGSHPSRPLVGEVTRRQYEVYAGELTMASCSARISSSAALEKQPAEVLARKEKRTTSAAERCCDCTSVPGGNEGGCGGDSGGGGGSSGGDSGGGLGGGGGDGGVSGGNGGVMGSASGGI